MSAFDTGKPSTGPLAGVKIVDMSTVVLGPFATQLLGDLGADIIKVEFGAGDIIRGASNAPAEGLGPLFFAVNRNKRCVRLDFKSELGAKAMRALLGEADVFFHNVRMKGVARAGFGYEDVARINPDIIYVHCAGFGSDGPYRDRQAYDDLIQAASGFTDLERMRNGTHPAYAPAVVADKSVGLYSVYATIAALYHRERTGQGQFVEVPMFEAFTQFNMTENFYGAIFDPPTAGYGYSRSINPRRRPFPTKDGFLAILPYSDDNWRKFFEIGGRPGMFDDPRFSTYEARSAHITEVYAIIEDILASKTTDEWLELFHAANVPVMRVNRMDEVMEDPHLKAVGLFQKRRHPRAGDYWSVRHPVKFSRTPADIREEPRQLGEDTEDVLRALGFSEDEIEAVLKS